MRNLLAITAATAVLALGASGANAAMLLHEDPTTGEKMVINTETESETAALAAEEGVAPADCPEGSYYVIEDASGTTVVECVTETRYRAVELDAAAEPVDDAPEGALILEAE